jgi:hypothetical protein
MNIQYRDQNIVIFGPHKRFRTEALIPARGLLPFYFVILRLLVCFLTLIFACIPIHRFKSEGSGLVGTSGVGPIPEALFLIQEGF